MIAVSLHEGRPPKGAKKGPLVRTRAVSMTEADWRTVERLAQLHTGGNVSRFLRLAVSCFAKSRRKPDLPCIPEKVRTANKTSNNALHAGKKD